MQLFYLFTIFLTLVTTGRTQDIYSSKQVYLESITKGGEFSCMKSCVPQDRKRFVDENLFYAPDPRPTYACDKNNDRPIDANLCKSTAAMSTNLTYLSGDMYLFPNMTTTSKLNWHGAMKACRSITGFQLASIVDEKTNNALAKFLTENKAAAAMAKDNFWTSGSSLGDELTWMETGDKIGFTNWVGGKPSGAGKCIQVALDKGKMVWKDVDCNTESRAFCEVLDECYKNICDG
ncbi:uncharacterized protein LOC132197867 [Neocloeon triangulifer]|uniref:uncharacterized protein LOC132197867 n=1 Tax=Neocloeon triangulifer TaxID=2078957 RepID=UPI00286F18E4|nr:uncharacterized protein LOC132197867 [Neocloeon triangulifer]